MEEMATTERCECPIAGHHGTMYQPSTSTEQVVGDPPSDVAVISPVEAADEDKTTSQMESHGHSVPPSSQEAVVQEPAAAKSLQDRMGCLQIAEETLTPAVPSTDTTETPGTVDELKRPHLPSIELSEKTESENHSKEASRQEAQTFLEDFSTQRAEKLRVRRETNRKEEEERKVSSELHPP